MTDVRVDNPADFPPQEDTVERLWTPQRMTYVLRNSEDRPTKPKTKECPFCVGPKKSDEDGLIAWRGTHVFAIMNLYPYNVGHLMICPYRHVGFITELDDAELFEFEKATTLAMKVMETVSLSGRIQHRHQSGRGRGCRSRRAPAPACGAALEWRCELHAHRRPDAYHADSAVRPARRLCPGIRTAGPAVSFAACLTGCGTRATGFIGTRNKTIIGNITGMSD